jgi:predicted ester cyclase
MSPGKQGVKAYFAAFRRAVPDLHAQVHELLADGDKVVTRKTFHGTQTGEFMGLPPTGSAISVDVIDIVRVRDGKFVEHWNVLDTLVLMRQMGGVAPPPG